MELNREPLLSVIIPVYNVLPFFVDTIKSLQSQISQTVRYILIDDGSTDGSGSLCDEIVSKDNRFIVIHQQNAGVSAARNAGLKYIKQHLPLTDYIIFVDADDVLLNNTSISSIAHLLRNKTPDILFYNYQIADNSVIKLKDQDFKTPQEIATIYEWSILGHSLNDGILGAFLWRVAIKTNLIFQNSIWFREDIRKAEDTIFIAQCIAKSQNISIRNTLIYNYRLRDTSITHGYTLSDIKSIKKSVSIVSQLLEITNSLSFVNKDFSKSYFQKRMIYIVRGYFINLSDNRGRLSMKEIYDRGTIIFSYPALYILYERIFEKNAHSSILYYLLHKKSILLWMLYGKAYHKIKLLLKK